VFKSDAYIAINRYLRQGAAPTLPPVSTIRRWVSDAHAALQVKPLDRAIIASRGLSIERDLQLTRSHIFDRRHFP